jgi:hypothetical protein
VRRERHAIEESRRSDSNLGPLHYERTTSEERASTRGHDLAGNRSLSRPLPWTRVPAACPSSRTRFVPATPLESRRATDATRGQDLLHIALARRAGQPQRRFGRGAASEAASARPSTCLLRPSASWAVARSKLRFNQRAAARIRSDLGAFHPPRIPRRRWASSAVTSSASVISRAPPLEHLPNPRADLQRPVRDLSELANRRAPAWMRLAIGHDHTSPGGRSIRTLSVIRIAGSLEDSPEIQQ